MTLLEKAHEAAAGKKSGRTAAYQGPEEKIPARRQGWWLGGRLVRILRAEPKS